MSDVYLDFEKILTKRKQLRRSSSYHGNLNQGSTISPFKTSPYSFCETLKYFSRIYLHVDLINECANIAPFGKQTKNHTVGVRKGVISQAATSRAGHQDSIKILFMGDLMLSDSGKPVAINDGFLEKVANADAIAINIESPVTFSEECKGRENLTFDMSKAYLKDFVDKIKAKNPGIEVIYNIANNHSLDGLTSVDQSQLSAKEQVLYDTDPDNFILMRTIAAIRELDPAAHIVGAHFEAEKYGKICSDAYPYSMDVSVPVMAMLQKGEARIGIVGYTDIMNCNQDAWQCRAFRSDDMPSLSTLKEEHQLDKLYLFGHGDYEHKRYTSKHWRDLSIKYLQDGADAVIGHGPHVPQTNEVVVINDQEKLMVHSIGNFFGPKLLDNTAIETLCELTAASNTTEFSLMLMEATVNDDHVPEVKVLASETDSQFPLLVKKFQAQYPIQEYKSDYLRFGLGK